MSQNVPKCHRVPASPPKVRDRPYKVVSATAATPAASAVGSASAPPLLLLLLILLLLLALQVVLLVQFGPVWPDFVRLTLIRPEFA